MGNIDEETLVDQKIGEEQEEPSLLDELELEDRNEDTASAADLIRMKVLAKRGSQDANLWLVRYYADVEHDLPEACYWACKSGDAAAKAIVAGKFEKEGNGEVALAFYKAAADAETDSSEGGTLQAVACMQVIRGYLNSDVHVAEEYMLRLTHMKITDEVRKAIPFSANMLSLQLIKEKDYDSAIIWTRFCLDLGDKSSDIQKRMLILCKLIKDQGGDEELLKKAEGELAHLAELGNVDAISQNWLVWFNRVKDDKSDETRRSFIKWLTLAADAGDGMACMILAMEYLNISKDADLAPDPDKGEYYYQNYLKSGNGDSLSENTKMGFQQRIASLRSQGYGSGRVSASGNMSGQRAASADKAAAAQKTVSERTEAPVQKAATSDAAADAQNTASVDTADSRQSSGGKEDKSLLCACSYLGPLVFIPILTARDNPAVRFHANQGLVLFIAFLLIRFVVLKIFPVTFLSVVLNGALLILTLLGIVRALTGDHDSPLPLIGGIHIL